MHYHAGQNLPGYLPMDDEPFTFLTFADARDSLADDMARNADSEESWVEEHDCDDIPCPTYGDSCGWNAAQNIRGAIEDLLAQGPAEQEWVGYGGNLAYWIVSCHEDGCLTDEDRDELAAAGRVA